MVEFDYFSKELTTAAMQFEIGLAIVLLWIMIYGILNYRFFVWKFLALAFWVFFFEWLTWALWINSNLWQSAYIHNDLSWVLTLAWASIIMTVKFVYDKIHSKTPCALALTPLKKSKHFGLIREFTMITVISSILWWLFVIYLKAIWVFSYSPEMQKVIDSWMSVFGRPLEAVIYLPVFMFTVYSFFKYWELAMQNKQLFINYSVNLKKDLIISAIVIALIGYLMHPLLIITSLWAYIILFIGYIINLYLTNLLISKIDYTSLFMRFVAWTFVFTTITTIGFSFFVWFWLIEISQSIKDTYTINTIQIPYLSITDVEWAWIYLFSFLMIAMIKYFKVIANNKTIPIDDSTMTFKWYKSLFTNK